MQPAAASESTTSTGKRRMVATLPRLRSDRLELLERLAAARAVAKRAARRRAEDVLKARVRRAAVRALERGPAELDDRRRAGLARSGGREAGLAELLAA